MSGYISRWARISDSIVRPIECTIEETQTSALCVPQVERLTTKIYIFKFAPFLLQLSVRYLTHFLFILLIARIAKAVEMPYVLRQGDRLILADKNCSAIQKNAEALRSWTLKFKEENCSLPKPNKTSGGCDLDITFCVPELVRKNQGIDPGVLGPNCFNLALVMNNIVPAFRETSPSELRGLVRPPLCYKLSDDETPSPGDIGLYSSAPQKGDMSFGKDPEKHAFIFVSEKLAFTKNGRAGSPYSLMSVDEMKRYSEAVDANCKYLESGCQSVNYYRCQSIADWMNLNPGLNPVILDGFNKMNTLEKCMQSSYTNPELTKHIRSNVQDVIAALDFYLDQQIKDQGRALTKEDRFLLSTLAERMNSIHTQLNNLQISWSNSTRELLQFNEKIYDAAKEVDGAKR